MHNVWWLNLQSPEAAFAFRQHGANQALWRTYHAEKVFEMVVQVWMTEELPAKARTNVQRFGRRTSPQWIATASVSCRRCGSSSSRT